MALATTHTPSILSGLTGLGNAFFDFLVRISETSTLARSAEARGQQIEALNAKTDEELAAMNLRRDDIVLHVFRDIMYI